MADYIFKRVNIKVNSVDSAIAFREIKAELFNYKKETNDVENVFGSALYRQEESIENYNGMEFFLNDYIHNNILRYFGITIDVYLSLTRPEMKRINKVAKEKLLQEQQIIENTRREQATKHGNVMFDDMGFKNA